ncbi:hypothetical protein [Qipengyuania sp. JC766]|uniref:hypothetical protein n=1 Tax=Qipengyuania sp. JC766 TaxID=3232139 RepID=UPI0034599980
MIYILQNLLPILAATLVGLLIGVVFLRRRGRALPRPETLILVAAAQFWFASILAGALILAPPQAGEWTMAIGSAVVIWIGFVAPAFIVTMRVRRVKWRTIWGVIFYWLATMVGQAAVMTLIGLGAPPA